MVKKLMALVVPLVLLAGSSEAATKTSWGRFSIFSSVQHSSLEDGTSREFSEVTSSLTLRSRPREDADFEYSFEVRGTAYPSSEGRSSRGHAYDAWVGRRMAGGRLNVRAGQMWLTDLGGVGSFGGVMAEYKVRGKTPASGMRFGLFGGMEPKSFELGYVPDVKKAGAWVGFDGERNRRHVFGYTMVKDAGLTERSVVTAMNFVPVGTKFFLYQAAEYDLSGPAGEGTGGLRYFFANARYAPARRVELMGTYHHGLSIDTRTITQDILNGRPVDQKALDGFLFESVGGRATVEVVPNVRVYAGYSKDKNNRDDDSTGRISAGLWASNIAGSGFDLTVSDNRTQRSAGAADAWYVSVGRSLGPRFYLSADYSNSLSVIRVTGTDGVEIETRPRARRYSTSALWNVNRTFSLNLTAEQLQDDHSTDERGLIGLIVRF